MKKNEKLDLIRTTGIIAIMRADSSDQLIPAADAIRKGGVKVIEVTMTTPGALQIIEQAKKHFGDDVIFGAGSVLDQETANTAILAGADFIVSPTLKLNVISLCNRYSIPVFPGCFTPTEALTAWEAGADMIKLFPVNIGGPGLLKSMLAPLPQLEIIPVGDINLNNAAEYLRNGAVALGIGTQLVNQKLLISGNFQEISSLANKYVSIVAQQKRP